MEKFMKKLFGKKNEDQEKDEREPHQSKHRGRFLLSMGVILLVPFLEPERSAKQKKRG
jgi:hypothetical protein